MRIVTVALVVFASVLTRDLAAFESYPARPVRAVTELTLPAIFSDHMVLQRGQEVRVWGWGQAGEEVTLTFAGQSKTVKVADTGTWLVVLDPMAASFEGRELRVRSGGKALVVKDVLVGEVWLCSGQSNMVFKLRNSREGALELACADYDALRFNKLPEVAWREPKADYPVGNGQRGRWVPCKGEQASECTAVGYYFALRLHRFLKVPVGIIDAAWGGTMAQHWTGKDLLQEVPEMKPYFEDFADKRAEWDKGGGPEGAKRRLAADLKAYEEKLKHLKSGERRPGRPRLEKDPSLGRQPAGAANGMIAPLSGYGLKGVLFYQGENNSFGESWQPFHRTFPRVIESFRRAFGDAELPFGIVQIAGWSNRRSMEYDQNHHCNVIREIQFDTWQQTPNTGLIVSFDCNRSRSIHPNWKRPVGERSARWALAEVYDARFRNRAFDWKGPVYEKMEIDGNKIIVHFKTRTLNLNRDMDVGFYIAGEDRHFHHARARVSGKTVIVWKDGLEKPVAVRYAISNLPIGELMGPGDLPAYPFRTDNWPIRPHRSTGEYVREIPNGQE